MPADAQTLPRTKTSGHLGPRTNNGMGADYKAGDPEAKLIFEHLTEGLQVFQEQSTHTQDKINHGNSRVGRRECNSSEISLIPKLESKEKKKKKKAPQELAR